MASEYFTALSALTIVLLPPLLQLTGWWKWADLIYRICLAELNIHRNKNRLAKQLNSEQNGRDAPRTMACMVGYREESAMYEKSLGSLARSNCECVVAAIDGEDDEDMKMVRVFEKVGILFFSSR